MYFCLFYHPVIRHDLIQQHYLFIFSQIVLAFLDLIVVIFFITLYDIDLSFLFVPWTIAA